MTIPTQQPAALSDERTHFNYLLNAFERASQADRPVDHGYRDKRLALFAYVRDLESKAAQAQPQVPAKRVTLNARQLRQALYLVNPDGLADEDQLATEVTIGPMPAMGEGEDAQPAGLNAWLTEYPEEGCYFLDPDTLRDHERELAAAASTHSEGMT